MARTIQGSSWTLNLMGGFIAASSLGLGQQAAAQELPQTDATTEITQVEINAGADEKAAGANFHCAPVIWSEVGYLRMMTPRPEDKLIPFKYENIDPGMPEVLREAKMDTLYYRSEVSQKQAAKEDRSDEMFVLNFMTNDEQSACQMQILTESLQELSKYAPYPIRLMNIKLHDENGVADPELLKYFERIYAVNRLNRFFGFMNEAERLLKTELPYIAVMRGGKIHWDYSISFDKMRDPGGTRIPLDLTYTIAAINNDLPPDYVSPVNVQEQIESPTTTNCLGMPERKPLPLMDASGKEIKDEERGRKIKRDKDGHPKKFVVPPGFMCRNWNMKLKDFALGFPRLEFKDVYAANSEGRPDGAEVFEGKPGYIRNYVEGDGTHVNARYFFPGSMAFPKKGGYFFPVFFHFAANGPVKDWLIDDMGFHGVEMTFYGDGIQPVQLEEASPEEIALYDTRGKPKNNFELILEELLEDNGKPLGWKDYLRNPDARFVHLVWGGLSEIMHPHIYSDDGAAIALFYDRESKLGAVLYGDDAWHAALSAHFDSGADTPLNLLYAMLHQGAMRENSEWRKATAPAVPVPITPEQEKMFMVAEEWLPPVIDLSYVVREHRSMEKAIRDIQRYYIRNANPEEGVVVVFDRTNLRAVRQAAEEINTERGLAVHHILYAQGRGKEKNGMAVFVTPASKSKDPSADVSLDDFYQRAQNVRNPPSPFKVVVGGEITPAMAKEMIRMSLAAHARGQELQVQEDAQAEVVDPRP